MSNEEIIVRWMALKKAIDESRADDAEIQCEMIDKCISMVHRKGYEDTLPIMVAEINKLSAIVSKKGALPRLTVVAACIALYQESTWEQLWSTSQTVTGSIPETGSKSDVRPAESAS